MAYSVFTDIQSEFKKLTFDGNSKVTSAEVTEFISQADANIDMKLSNIYVTPITATESLKVLKKISIDFVAYRVGNILDLKKEAPLPDGRIVQYFNKTAAYKESSNLLDKLMDGIVRLPDASELSSGTAPASYNSDNSIEPIFERDTTQW